MLNWWLGTGRPEDERNADDLDRDPPETPAPVFAARALKSALFGTPAPADKIDYEVENESVPGKSDTRKLQYCNLSPAKPPGILMTPGTTASRRKTVTFGLDVIENEKRVAKASSTNCMPDNDGGKQLSPWAPILEPSDTKTWKRSITRQLEEARERKPSDRYDKYNLVESKPLLDLDSDGARESSESHHEPGKSPQEQKDDQKLGQQLAKNDEAEGDATIDINKPHSQSGKYWKSEFENYHEEARSEMRKLLAYKEAAKSYAKMKDAQSINLAQKLRQEQKKLLAMEDKISALSTRISTADADGADDECPILMKELASQTARAVQFKEHVDEFRALVEVIDPKVAAVNSRGDKNNTSPGTFQHTANPVTSAASRQDMLQMWNETQTKLNEAIQENKALRESIKEKDEAISKLKEENTKLTQELLHTDLRLEKATETCGQKQQLFQEQRKMNSELIDKMRAEYTDLNNRTLAKRQETAQVSKKRNEEVLEYRKEIASLKGAESKCRELQLALDKKNLEHDILILQSERKIQTLSESLQQEVLDSDQQKELNDIKQKMLPPAPPIAAVSKDTPYGRESHIPKLTHSIARPSKTMASNCNHIYSDNLTHSTYDPSSHSALSEIVNSANVDTVPPQGLGPVQHTPLISNHNVTNLLSPSILSQPLTNHSSPELSPTDKKPSRTRVIHDRNCHASPRPSMFRIEASPPKPAVTRKRSSKDLGRANIASSRLGNLEGRATRVTLPPERAEAAKRRLAEKKRLAAASAASNDAGEMKENPRV